MSPVHAENFSLWTLLAPAALVVLVIMLFNALGESCVIKKEGCDKPDAVAKEDPKATTKGGKDLPRRYTVRKGDNFGAIADKFGLTEAQLKKCNAKRVTDPTSLGVGTVLSIKRCKDIKTEDDPI